MVAGVKESGPGEDVRREAPRIPPRVGSNPSREGKTAPE